MAPEVAYICTRKKGSTAMMDDGTRLRNRINKQVYTKYPEATVDLV